MKVTFLNTFEKDGGAGAAGFRIFESIKEYSSIDAQYVAQFKSPFSKYHPENFLALCRIGAEKYTLKKLLKNKSDLFKFETATKGIDVLQNQKVREADILHLHWINQGYVSLKTLDKLANQKKIVWTLHDMWPVTGGCSYPGKCEQFINQCGSCPFLKSSLPDDLSRSIWGKKNDIINGGKIFFVGPSKWISDKVKASGIGKEKNIFTIPNPIDVDVFNPDQKEEVRNELGIDPNKQIILFGAQNLDDERKGFELLKNAIDQINQNNPQLLKNSILLLFGASKVSGLEKGMKMETQYFGPIAERRRLIKLYNAADFYIHGATDDNLPNMVIEAMACGTPCLAFNTGGIPEVINMGYNGYLIDKTDSENMAKGIVDFLAINDKWQQLSKNARKTVEENFSPQIIAGKYMKIYQELMLL